MKKIHSPAGLGKKNRHHLKSALRFGKKALMPLIPKKEEDEGESGSTQGINVSYLVEETLAMERMQRIAEQEGHRRLGAKVHAREHSLDQHNQAANEGDLQNSIPQHPLLDGQRFDGVDTNLNPEPPLNTEARREFDNERREQEMEKQLRLGNMPKFSATPTPKPG